jgi:L-cystine uptake protein TcyP (sodium:dicarboxylate symporter family)
VVAEELLVQLDCIFDFFVFNDFLELLLEIREKSDALSKIVLLPILTEVIGVALRLVISLSEL